MVFASGEIAGYRIQSGGDPDDSPPKSAENNAKAANAAPIRTEFLILGCKEFKEFRRDGFEGYKMKAPFVIQICTEPCATDNRFLNS
jgi:hypothetical protein